MFGVAQRLRNILSLDGALAKKEVKQRSAFFLFALVAGAIVVLTVIGKPAEMLALQASFVGIVVMFATCVAVVVAILCRWKLRTAFIVGVVYCQCVSVFVWDLEGRTTASPGWPILVLMIDILLVMQVDTRYSMGLLGFTVVWLLLVALEETFRFGLLDMPGLRPQEGEHGRREYFSQMMDCVSLPCPVEFPPRGLSPALGVFVLDFLVTRGFAREVLKEQASMERTINVMQKIAFLLARYDVDNVADMLETHKQHLPAEMAEALRSLEENLRSYRAYLPQTCLPLSGAIETQQLDDTYLSSESSSRSEMSTMRLSAVRTLPALSLTAAKVTLVTLNTVPLLHEEDCTMFSQLFTTVLQKALYVTELRQGVIDVFIGDKIHCSFNASKQCVTHASAALHSALLVLHPSTHLCAKVNIGIATGSAFRGEMGCDVMRRFNVVGNLLRDVDGMERVGRALGCAVLCNRLCFSDAECEHTLRLIPCKVELGPNDPEIVAELIMRDNDDTDGRVAAEWMYTIGVIKDWEEYNTAVRGYLKGTVSSQVVAEAAQKGDCIRFPITVVAAEGKCDVISMLPTHKEDS